ncbi:MAG: hypothetical protein GY805_35495, partial [Chloroflexi bacterium]|nr:hypothetical protein [Chloroflexota bacterium]
MEEKTLFSFKSTNLSFANFLTWLLLSIIPFGCLVSLVGSILISSLAEKLFSLELPSYFMFVLFALLVIGGLLNGFKNRLVMLTINNEKLQWRTTWKKRQQLTRNEIQEAKFDKKGRLILNNTFVINPKVLPLKRRIEFGTVLPQWLPETTHTPEYQEHLRWKKNFIENWQDAPFSIIAHTNKQRYIWLRRIGFAGIAILTGLIIWFSSVDPPQGIPSILIFLGTVLFFFSIGIWKSTEYKSVQVNEKGITYQRGK